MTSVRIYTTDGYFDFKIKKSAAEKARDAYSLFENNKFQNSIFNSIYRMPIKSNHDIYLFNHRNFTNYIYDNRYGIYVPDRLLLYFTLYKNKLED